MRKTIPFLIILLQFSSVYTSNGQGCSDAGFCTLNNFKPGSLDTMPPVHQIRFGASAGGADHSITVFGNYLEYDRRLGKRFGMDVKLASLAQSGSQANTFGLSDVYANLHYQFAENVKLSVGAKIPLTDGNTLKDGLPLPMDYQSSLGTIDLIVGLAYGVGGVQLAAALQQPLTQNENTFLVKAYAGDTRYADFQPTNQFKRKSDVLLRGSYPIPAGSKFKISPSLLLIYHLGNDEYTGELGKKLEIKGSSGLTLNTNVYLDYEVNLHNAFQLSLGIPFIVRDVRPDGLTRSFVANLEYRVRF